MGKKEKSEGEGVDRINELPDEILSHILSFLPSLESVATCLLSKRWRHLWEMVPVLHIQLKKDCHLKVNEFSRLRRTEKITSFHLDCKIYSSCYVRSIFCRIERHPDYKNHMEKWVDEAITGEVKHVNLDLQNKQDWDNVVSFPMRLLTCTTIVTMNIKGPSINLCVPSGIQLPSLKSLHLNVLKCEQASCKEFLSGSPALEVFYLEKKSLRKKLRIERNSHWDRIVSVDRLLELVIQSGPGYDYVQDYLEGHLENIVKAKVSMTLLDKSYSRKIVHLHTFSILKSIPNVEFLSLRDPFKSYMVNLIHDLPQFPNLVRFNLHVTDLHHSPYLKLPAQCPKLEKYWLNDRRREL